MHIVDDPVETIHVYMVKEEEKRPYTVLPLVCAFLCLLGVVAITMYSARQPAYERQQITVPATFLPLKVFKAEMPIIPTGVKTYPAMPAYGTLTVSNGSVASQTLPAGLVFISKSGVSVVTDQAVFVPAGSADGFGVTTVPAHAMIYGKKGNIVTYDIDYVEGVNIYVRNLSAFTGGKDSYSVKFATTLDKQTALLQARGILLGKSIGLHDPCIENHFVGVGNMVVTWQCQFVSYHVPPYMHVSAVQLVGTHVILSVWYLPPVRQVRLK